ncbi:MAG: RimK family alpha-L-glutamate ligase [Haliscomenobacter sp.]|nr:RimK family alpha-L-glutamate ligase [Haliscomenobacter sp.]
MNIAILSRGPQLYSTQSLFRAGLLRGHSMQIIDHTQCVLGMENGKFEVYHGDLPLSSLDAVIPRIGTSVTQEGISLISHLELMNVFTSTRSQGLWQARDKLRALQRLQGYGIEIPNTFFPSEGTPLGPIVERLGGLPVVIKMIESTHGIGVMLAETMQNAQSTLDAFHRLNTRVVLQEFIREVSGTDIRALVVNGKPVAAMKRIAQEGEFRSNLHRGGRAISVKLTEKERSVVIKAARIMGLDVAGVDLLRSNRGPLVMEVNASPGLEGIETTTGVDVAGRIIQFIERKVMAKTRVKV